MTDGRTEANDRQKVSAQTRQFEQRDAQAEHTADRPPTEDEERLAEDEQPSPEVSEHFEEMTELGVNQKGEGRI